MVRDILSEQYLTRLCLPERLLGCVGAKSRRTHLFLSLAHKVRIAAPMRSPGRHAKNSSIEV